MNTIKVDFTNEDILTGLYKLASIGAARSLNIDLIKLEELSVTGDTQICVSPVANVAVNSVSYDWRQ